MARNKERVRRADSVVEMTPEQVREFAKCAHDVVYFCRKYVRIQHPIRGSIPFDLYPYQIKMLKAYQEHRYTVVLSARQTGKALDITTKIPTPNGWTTMGDIKPGDMVFGSDGEPTSVTGVSDIMYNHNCFKITFDTGDSVIADEDHLWEVRDEYTRTTKVITTGDMVAVKYVNDLNQARFTVKTTQPLKLDSQKLPIDPYTLGVWLGDGTSRTSEITLHEDDLEILDYISDHTEMYIRGSSKNRQHIKCITLYGLLPKLRKLGVKNNKHIPLSYLRSSEDQRLSLLQGLMDTDGTVDGMGRGQCDITLSNETLANDVYQLVCSLGLKPTIRKRLVGQFYRWEVKFSAYKQQVPVFRLTRKLNRMKNHPNATRQNSTKKRSIQSIIPVDSVPVRCITVDNADHLFLFGDGLIPTHNSVTSAIFLLWKAIFNKDQKILIASNKNAGAMEMVARIKHAYEELPMWLKPGVKDDGFNKHAIHFDNGSQVDSVATSEDSARGKSVSLLFLDEFAFVKPSIQTEFWSAVLPTLSTGGSCIMTSTPNGDENLFAQMWRAAETGLSMNAGLIKEGDKDKYNDITFFPIQVKWDEPPGRDEAFKQQQISQLGELLWRQEYLCEFLSSDQLLIDTLVLQLLTTRDVRPPIKEINGFKFWEDITQGSTYIVGIDPATGSGLDFTVIQLFHFPSMIQVAQFRSNTMSSPEVYRKLKWLFDLVEQRSGTIYFSIENNGVGEGIIALYMNDDNPPEFCEFVTEGASESSRMGFHTSGRKKMKACVDVKHMIETNKMTLRSESDIKEFKNFVRKRDSYSAQIGSTDDCICATLICIRVLTEIAMYEQAAFEKLYSYGVVDQDGYYDGECGGDAEPLPVLL